MRLPWTIWRYTLLEMWRLLLLTSVVLVVVISFAVTVRLTAEGRLGPLDTLKYMFLAMPPMLQYALPFAAGFGATLAYHRMAQDNELVAAAAGGIGHRLLLVPSLASGVVLAGVIWGLNGWVIPSFLRDMAQVVEQDATRLVYNTLSSGQPLEVGDMQIHADSARRLGPDPSIGATDRLLLTGVFGVRLNKQGKVVGDVSARRAFLEFAPALSEEPSEHGATLLTVTMQDASGVDPERAWGGQGNWTFAWAVPSEFNDDPKYLTNRELRSLPADPDRLNTIDMRRRDVAIHLAAEDTCVTIDRLLRAQGSARLLDGAGRTITVRGAGMEYREKTSRWELLPARGKGVEVEVSGGPTQADAAPKWFAAATGGLRLDLGRDRETRRLRLRLEIEDLSSRTVDSEAQGARRELEWTGLRLTPEEGPEPLADLLARSSRQLLAEAERRDAGGRDPFVRWPAEDLRDRLKRLMREIVSKRHERAADAAACLVMVVAGAVTAMRLGGSLPLAVYLWSFFPALFTVITIATGQQMTHHLGMGGLAVLWGGVGVLGAYALVAFMAVRRH